MKMINPGQSPPLLIGLCILLISVSVSSPASDETTSPQQPAESINHSESATPEAQVIKSRQRLQHIREQIRQYTRTTVGRNTDLMFDHQSIRVEHRFSNRGITTEFRAEKDGDLRLRINIPF